MTPAPHPNWCDPMACTAYGPDVDEYHRSSPIIIRTDDPVVRLFVYKIADRDGSYEFIEMALIEPMDDTPWHLTEPIMNREILLPSESVDEMQHALAQLV